MPTNDELDRRVFGVETNTVGLTKVLRELIHRMTLLTLAIREPEAVTETDLNEMLEGLRELDALLTSISEFLPDVGD